MNQSYPISALAVYLHLLPKEQSSPLFAQNLVILWIALGLLGIIEYYSWLLAACCILCKGMCREIGNYTSTMIAKELKKAQGLTLMNSFNRSLLKMPVISTIKC